MGRQFGPRAPVQYMSVTKNRFQIGPVVGIGPSRARSTCLMPTLNLKANCIQKGYYCGLPRPGALFAYSFVVFTP